MKRYLSSLGWILLLVPFVSLAGTRAVLDVTSKKQSSDWNNLPEFKGVGNAGSANVHITIGNTQSVRVDASEETKSRMELKVKGDVLNIGFKSGSWMNFNPGRVDVYITMKSISSIAQSGSGHIDLVSTARTKNLSLAVSGSGRIVAQVGVENISSQISGSGRIEVSGKAENLSVSVSGSGRFSGDGLSVANATANVSGSGRIEIQAEKALTATVSGSGAIGYAGNAQVSQRVSGSGRIYKK